MLEPMIEVVCTCVHTTSILQYIHKALVFLFCSVISGLDPALLGLALTYAVTLSDLLQYTARQSAEVENLVGDAKV